MNTINYYNSNALAFHMRTISKDMTEHYSKFLKYLPHHACILDAGCGSGRDTKHFLAKGYKVTAFDASQEMIKYATQETGAKILHMQFQDINFLKDFNAVWASASLIHVPYNETTTVYEKIYNSLQTNGIFYASYKYGLEDMQVDSRDFYNMTELTIIPYLNNLFEVIDIWETPDLSHIVTSTDKKWLNIIMKKSNR